MHGVFFPEIDESLLSLAKNHIQIGQEVSKLEPFKGWIIGRQKRWHKQDSIDPSTHRNFAKLPGNVSN